MAWLRPLAIAAVPSLENNVSEIYPFEDGRSYWQLDLDGRDGVEGVAEYYHSGNTTGIFANKLVDSIVKQINRDIGSIAVYTAIDETNCRIAYVYGSENSYLLQYGAS